MGEAKPEGTWGARILIIIYAAALVLIGSYPIKREYGSVLEFLRKQSRSWAGDLRSQRSERARLNVTQSSKVLQSAQTREAAAKTAAKEIHSEPSIVLEKNSSKRMDNLTKQDRAQLNGLLNSLDGKP